MSKHKNRVSKVVLLMLKEEGVRMPPLSEKERDSLGSSEYKNLDVKPHLAGTEVYCRSVSKLGGKTQTKLYEKGLRSSFSNPTF